MPYLCLAILLHVLWAPCTTPSCDHSDAAHGGLATDYAENLHACGCSDREKALGMAIVTLIVVFFLTR